MSASPREHRYDERLVGGALVRITELVWPDGGRSYHYLAGTLYGVRITALIDGGDELLVSLTAPAAAAPLAASGPLDKVFRVTASECSLARVRRWRDEGTLLRAYLSHDGAIMLADPMLGGNAACEPATTVTWQARKRTTSADQSPHDNS